MKIWKATAMRCAFGVWLSSADAELIQLRPRWSDQTCTQVLCLACFSLVRVLFCFPLLFYPLFSLSSSTFAQSVMNQANPKWWVQDLKRKSHGLSYSLWSSGASSPCFYLFLYFTLKRVNMCANPNYKQNSARCTKGLIHRITSLGCPFLFDSFFFFVSIFPYGFDLLPLVLTAHYFGLPF